MYSFLEEAQARDSESEKKSALFSVVKGRTGLCRIFCRTGSLLICLGRGKEEGDMAEQREEECRDKGKKRWTAPPFMKRRRWEALIEFRTVGKYE